MSWMEVTPAAYEPVRQPRVWPWVLGGVVLGFILTVAALFVWAVMSIHIY